MDNAMMLAKIFGPFLMIMGLWMLVFCEHLMKVWTAIRTSPFAIYAQGTLNLLVGLVMLEMYNVWQADAFVFVTLLGWFWVIRGVLCLFFPKTIIKWQFSREGVMKGMGILPLVWGLILSWIAFFM
jgi:hypothetical protein